MFDEEYEIEEEMYDYDVDEEVDRIIMERIEREQEKAFTYLKKENICGSWKSKGKFHMSIRSEYGNIHIEFPDEIIKGA